ncbi:hypothetical protein AB0P05_42865 [Streptomyces flaveolus]|uniref:hypothetical protein n=1 Tax=Streptomyces flaveolus TaxID=67297 RepID=UPI0034461D4A
MHLPEKYGNWRGLHNQLRMWTVAATWERVFTAVMAQADADEDLDRAVSMDSTIVQAHQHAAGAHKKGPRPANPTTMPPPRDRHATPKPRQSPKAGPEPALAYTATAGANPSALLPFDRR